MNRGSTWNIWDFHLHTPCSVLNNQFGDPTKEETWDHYIDQIEQVTKQKKVVALGITDYFTIEGYKQLLDYKNRGRLNDIFIFPNIEFRVDKVIYKSKDGKEPKRLNFHVLFSPEIQCKQIEENFLHNLGFVYENNPFESSHIAKLSPSNLTDFGENLCRQHPNFRDKSPFEIGCSKAVVSVENIKKILDDDKRFKGKYLLVLAEENLSIMSWEGQDHAVRKQLLQMSHAVFSSNDETRSFCLGKKHENEESYIAEFKSLKPCLWGCDSHSYDQRFIEPDNGRNCWIKGKVSWEGLKQILYEPEKRVIIQENNPEPEKSFYSLNSIKIKNSNINNSLSIDEINIDVNSNLVTVIGGRGSGKTALLDLIASCFKEGNKLVNLSNSFYYRIYSENIKGYQNSEPVPITIQFRSEEIFDKKVGEDDSFFDRSDILYLTQNHLDDYTSNPSKLYQHIINLVFDQNPEKRLDYDILSNLWNDTSRSIQEKNLKIYQLKEEVTEKLPNAHEEYNQKHGELTDYKKRLSEREKQKSNYGEETTKLTALLNSLSSKRNQLINLSERLKNLFNLGQNFHDHYKLEIKTINDHIENLNDIVLVEKFPVELQQLITFFQMVGNYLTEINTQIPIVENKILNAKEEINKFEGIDQVLVQIKLSINAINDEIEKIKSEISDLEEKKAIISKSEEERNNDFYQLTIITVKQKIFLQKMIDLFESNQDELLMGLTFRAQTVILERDDYLNQIYEKIDGRVHSYDSIKNDIFSIVEEIFEILNSINYIEENEDFKSIRIVIRKLHHWTQIIKLKKTVTETEFLNIVFRPFFKIGLHIEFNNRPLEKLSMGERAVVLLKILLGLDDKPLFIDQPEEHLDNRYIYNELIPAFRCAKTKRQIFIATHNANLVVNTDAEQIIVAENKNNHLSYQIGALEDIEIREQIKTILEGGDKAFKKREAKYGYLF